jgi:hypothetical protein
VRTVEPEIQRTKEKIAVATDKIAEMEREFQSSLSIANACGRAFAMSTNGSLMYRGELLSNVLGFDIR